MCWIEDADRADFLSEKWVVARKTHICVECTRSIQPGERYERTFMVYAGQKDTYKTCEQCTAARSWLQRECGGWLYEGVREELIAHWNDYVEWRKPSFGRLIVAFKRKWAYRGGLISPIAVGRWATAALPST